MSVGITSLPAMAATHGVLQGINAEVAAMTATLTASAATLMPPGMEGASAYASAAQIEEWITFGTNFGMGIEQFEELLVSLEMAKSATTITDIGAAARQGIGSLAG